MTGFEPVTSSLPIMTISTSVWHFRYSFSRKNLLKITYYLYFCSLLNYHNIDNHNLKWGVYLIKSGEICCPACGGGLKYYDKIRRSVRLGGSDVEWLKIRRYICLGCGRVHNELPGFLVPFKHYSAEIVRGFIFGELTTDDLRFEDYPCEATIRYWRANPPHGFV